MASQTIAAGHIAAAMLIIDDCVCHLQARANTVTTRILGPGPAWVN